MLSLEQIYRIQPKLRNLPEEDVLVIREKLYQLGELAIQNHINKSDSKNLKWLLSDSNDDNNIKL